ncbi:MAG: ATP-binding cassette domain-containing protein [Alphaproteobacteria bacterium]|nr:ATP-binding cassette domain-containing protein [Alphaproteobacteria bacterium]
MSAILPLTVEGLGFAAGGETLLAGIGFALRAGMRSVVLGPNGAGKSLLLRLLHGLIRPTAGSMRWSAPEPARVQALVFQRPVLLRRSVAANIYYALELRGVSDAGRVDEALARTGLTALADRPARVLSGGEQQRLALARAWATRPELLLLDEPTANLDPAATRAVEEIVAAIHAAGTKIVMTTHDLGQARRLADEVLFLHRGRLVEHRPATEFFAAPASEAARAFLKGDLPW